MSSHSRGRLATITPGYGLIPTRRMDAVGLLTVYTFLLMAIPSALGFAPLGGAGSPANIYAAILLLWYIVIWLHPGFTVDHEYQPIRTAGLFYFCVTLAAYVSANRHSMPGLESNAADRGIISMAGWLGVLLIAADGIRTMDRLRILLRRIVLGATAMAALGITQFFTGLDATKYIVIPGLTRTVAFSDLQTRYNLNRPSATAAHPLEFAAVLAMCLPLAIHQARFAPPDLRRRRWIQVALIAGALPMTVSRTAILALITAAVMLIPTWPRPERRRAYVVIFVFSLITWLGIPGLIGTIRDLFLLAGTGTDSSTQSRTGAFGSAAPFISQHPWFGRGFGTFLPQTYFFLDDQYLGTTIETGVIGLLALISLFVTGWLVARNARRTSANERTRDMAQCLAAAIAVSAVCFFTFDALSFAIAAGLTFLLLGCVGAAWRLMRAELPTLDTVPPDPRSPVTAKARIPAGVGS
jgi:O-antigen ligase